jgi:hypothetical protein
VNGSVGRALGAQVQSSEFNGQSSAKRNPRLPLSSPIRGGLFNQGSATLIETIVSQNTVAAGSGAISSNYEQTGGFARGGGIYNTATLTLIRDTIADNSIIAGTGGQDDANTPNGPRANGAPGGDALGAGVFNSGTVTLSQSTLSGNSALAGVAAGFNASHDIFGGNAHGGGLYNSGTATVTQVTRRRATLEIGSHARPGVQASLRGAIAVAINPVG